MKAKRVVVLGAQVPFVRGGAERLNDCLVEAINERLPGVSAELVQVPFRWYPEVQLLKDMAAWRLLDLSESNGNKIDLCLATKFPTYVARHPNKVTWLVHQHRVFYDLENSEFDVPHHSADDRMVRKKVTANDARFLGESREIFTISDTVSERLQRYNGLDSKVLYPPPELAERIQPGEYGDYLLYIGRVERIKRLEPLINCLTTIPALKVVIAGTGEHLAALQDYAESLGVASRCRFEGYVSNERYLSLLSGARAVYYAPVDEDYGFATVEAMLAIKPLLTLADSGEVARLVRRTGGGFIAEPDSGQLQEIIRDLLDRPPAAIEQMMGEAHEFARGISWQRVLDKLVTPFL